MDDGPGLPADEATASSRRATRRGSDGGFGLASVRQLVIAHGWEITATDGEAGGARFEITDAEVE